MYRRQVRTLCENRSMKKKATMEGGGALMLFLFPPLSASFFLPPLFSAKLCAFARKRGEGGGDDECFSRLIDLLLPHFALAASTLLNRNFFSPPVSHFFAKEQKEPLAVNDGIIKSFCLPRCWSVTLFSRRALSRWRWDILLSLPPSSSVRRQPKRRSVVSSGHHSWDYIGRERGKKRKGGR